MASDSPINMMIVDDSRVMRNILETIIHQDSSIKLVTTAANGQEAIDELKKNPAIDIVSLDIQVPVMDGLQAILCKGKMALQIPALAAAPGIPQTTLVSWSCAITTPELSAIEVAPFNPSEPIPVKITAKVFSESLLKLLNMGSADGRQKFSAGASLKWIRSFPSIL